MDFRPADLRHVGLEPQLLQTLLHEHQHRTLPRLDRLWEYYRNHLVDGPAAADARMGQRRYRLAQEQGLPVRLSRSADFSLEDAQLRREIVIENDIAWRIHTLVDFMFGKPFVLQSLAEDAGQAGRIETLLRTVFEQSGGIGFFQDLALLGSVHGYVDVLLRVDWAHLPAPDRGQPDRDLSEPARCLALEIIEAPRVIPVLCPDDYRRLDALVIYFSQRLNQVENANWFRRLGQQVLGTSRPSDRVTVERTEIWTTDHWMSFRDRLALEQGVNRLGRIPVVHIQNLPQPFFYEGLSEVEPLIPLQDELNIRLSDRANRVTFQSFKMYLGKGIEGFTERPVGPGQMWATDNLEAEIQEFGGDAQSPSEDAHINQVRDAMDKTSGVNAVAAGLLRDKVGNLTSENALRIVLMGLLAKTEKRRITYGAGIERLCELILHAADVAGLLPTRPAERRIRIDWPSPLPENNSQRLADALIKIQLGVPRSQVLTELGYAEIV